ncbi:MauE/DoxX family redox-associated membrane protein [Aureispira anguillae]|uniref:Doxx family protein n=1 Tax=Aureispira anguillae TaxID=2864201 RepID=A0A915YI13_9BACT|nr:MauE/DoxX family redox-associated membrane protein [Aureispira anguillae]BDS13351.1 doxx family protein [Aureispira anguillae]
MTIYTLFLYIGIVAIVLTATLGVGHSKLKEHPVTHPLQWLIQYFVGSLLIFSGLVKAVDPLGTAYKMKDYFTEFDIQGLPFMDVMHDYALAFSLVMLVLELVLGVSLILGLGQRKTTWTTLLMMLFFTFLTGFNYLTGYTSKSEQVGFLDFANWENFSDGNIRITDCGCFGDFLKLKPIETFIKDIIYTVLAIFLVLNTNKLKELLPRDKKLGPANVRTLVGWGLTIIASWFCLQNFYFNKPMVDFRPFAEGMDLRAAKEECAANTAVVETIYTYKNKETGKEQVVKATELSQFPYLWEEKDAAGENVWESQKDKTQRNMIKEGCTSQIQYFEFPEILDESKYNFLVVGGDLDKADKNAFRQIGEIAAQAEKEGYATRALYYYTHKQTVDEFRHDVNGAYEFHTADDKLLKTIVRANPGLVLMKDGKVVKKWHHKHIPTYAEIAGSYMK